MLSISAPSRAFFRPVLLAAALAMASTAAQAAITLTPSTHDFGNVEVGQTAGPIRVTLYNEPSTGSDPILMSMGSNGSGPGSPQVASVNVCRVGTNLMRGESCVFDVSLEVTGTGAITGTLDFEFMGWQDMALTFTATGVPAGTGPVAVPTVGTLGLGLLSLALGAAAFARRQRKA